MTILVLKEDASLYYDEASQEEILEQERISKMDSYEYSKYLNESMFK